MTHFRSHRNPVVWLPTAALILAPTSAAAQRPERAFEYADADYRTEPFLVEQDAYGFADTTRPDAANLFYIVWFAVPGWDEPGARSAFDLASWAMENIRIAESDSIRHSPVKSLVRAPYGLHLFFELSSSPDVGNWLVEIGERDAVPLRAQK